MVFPLPYESSSSAVVISYPHQLRLVLCLPYCSWFLSPSAKAGPFASPIVAGSYSHQVRLALCLTYCCWFPSPSAKAGPLPHYCCWFPSPSAKAGPLPHYCCWFPFPSAKAGPLAHLLLLVPLHRPQNFKVHDSLITNNHILKSWFDHCLWFHVDRVYYFVTHQ
jgi:hypothetical protein